MATHSSVLAWRIPGTAEPGGLPSVGSHRVGHDWNDLAEQSRGIDQEVWGNGSIFYVASVLMKKEGEVLASQKQSAMHPGEMKNLCISQHLWLFTDQESKYPVSIKLWCWQELSVIHIHILGTILRSWFRKSWMRPENLSFISTHTHTHTHTHHTFLS